MRIKITGEKAFIDHLAAALAKDGVQSEPADVAGEKTELRLGLLEVAAIIAIAANAARLIEYLIMIARHLKKGEKKRLEVKTAAATTLVEIDNKSTPQDLEKQLSVHGATAGTQSGTPSGSASDAEKK